MTAALIVAVLGGAIYLGALIRTKREAQRRVLTITRAHLPALIRRRAQLLTVDAYGTVRSEKWSKEVDYFFETQIAPTLSNGQIKSALKNWDHTSLIIEQEVSKAAIEGPAFTSVPLKQLSPGEFEASCAEQLRMAGWEARVVGQSGDQGIDVLAQRQGIQVALQCKRYSGPVGNKAVQEAATGRIHYGAHFAAVVSIRDYTPAAQRLAATTKTFLLHHSQLRDLASILEPAALPSPIEQSSRTVVAPVVRQPSKPQRSSFGLKR